MTTQTASCPGGQADICSYDERVLPSIGNEVLKATVAQFDGTSPYPPTVCAALADRHAGTLADEVASELITNREIVSARIRDDLLNRAKEFNIMLEDVSIVSTYLATPVLKIQGSEY